LFHLIAANVSWYKEPQKLPDNEKYASNDRGNRLPVPFLRLAANEDWNEAGEVYVADQPTLKQISGGLGDRPVWANPSRQGLTAGRFVPYENQTAGAEYTCACPYNPAKRCVVTGFMMANSSFRRILSVRPAGSSDQ